MEANVQVFLRTCEKKKAEPVFNNYWGQRENTHGIRNVRYVLESGYKKKKYIYIYIYIYTST